MLSDDVLVLLRVAAAAAAERKAFHLKAMDVAAMTSLADSFLLCSGAHARQVAAIAEAIQRRLRAEGRRPLHVEGERESEWVLLDYGEIVIHVFSEERRTYYGLDGLWGDAKTVSEEELLVQTEHGGRT
ncbi:MAG: ribosome silencing factor [Acidobacteria bacterium]|nr:ribosome silencing factor [Acidobacteriota bacterium]